MVEITLEEGEELQVCSRQRRNKAYAVLVCMDGNILNRTSDRELKK